MGQWSDKVNEAMQCLSGEYEREITSLAKDVAERVKGGDEVGDAIHSAVDDHQWVIYTYSNWLVCAASRSDPFDYLSDMGIDKPTSAQLAYACMYQDLSDEVERIGDDTEED